MYLGETGLNRTTLAKVGKVFSNTNPPDYIILECLSPRETGPFDLSKLFIDADNNNRSVVAFYQPW